MDLEPLITFGHTKKKFLTDIYNARISFPDRIILLAMADIKACFRHGRLHPDLTGAFGFNAEQYYYLATAMELDPRLRLLAGKHFVEASRLYHVCMRTVPI